MIFEAIIEYYGNDGYPREKVLSRKTLKGFEKALQKIIDEKHIAIRYVSPNLQDNDLINSLPAYL